MTLPLSAVKRKPVRLFRALAALLVCLLAVQGVEMLRLLPDTGQAEAADAPPASNAPDEDATHEGEAEPAKTDHASEEKSCPGGKDFAHETGLSQYEIQVLRSLAGRREALDRRGQELDIRAKAAEAAEIRLTEQIAQLRSLEGELRGVLGQMEVRRDQRMDGLVRVYETMKPKDAARIFDSLTEDVLLDMAARMKAASLSAIMAKMSADQARLLTRLLAKQVVIPNSMAELQGQSG